jgi:hypothetical protein
MTQKPAADQALLPRLVGSVLRAKFDIPPAPIRTENYILAMKSPFSDDAAPISSSN